MFKIKNIVVLFTVLAALGLSGDVWGMKDILNYSGRLAKEIKTTEANRALQKFEVNLLSYKPFYDFNNKTLALLDPKELSDRTKRLENVKNVITEAANTYYNSFAAFMFSLFTGAFGYVLPKNNVSLAAKIGLSGLLSRACTEEEQGKFGKACVYAAGLAGLYTGNKIMSGAHHVAAKVVSGIQVVI